MSTTPALGTPVIPAAEQAAYDAGQDAKIRTLRRQGTALGCVLAALIVGAVAYVEHRGWMPDLAVPPASAPVVHLACPPSPPCPACAACPACPARCTQEPPP